MEERTRDSDGDTPTLMGSELETISPGRSLLDDSSVEGAPGPSPASTPPDSIARFVVLEVLGSGAMGIVYAAWDPQLDRRVALKVVRPGRARADAQDRLVREAQGMARLNHPNVVSVFDVGRHEGGVWIAMEYVQGETLLERLNQRPPPGWREILTLFAQAGEGLLAAHEADLVHRDFKPENVLIGQDGRVRVADFGLVRPSEPDPEASWDHARETDQGSDAESPGHAPDSGSAEPGLPAEPDLPAELGMEATALQPPKVDAPTVGLSDRLTADGAFLGTPRFMAPEQFHRFPTDARCDQFSFCVALYHALYREWPFAGADFYKLAAAVTLGVRPTLPTSSPFPPSIGAAILRGLAKSPGDRFPNMRELLDALEPEEPRQRRWPWAGMSLLAAAAAAALTTWAVSGEPEPVDPCVQGQAQASQAWGPQRRTQLEQRFATLDIGFDVDSLRAVDEALTRWTGDWSGEYRRSCEARHEQSAQRYDLRMACLAQQRVEVEGLVGLFAEADAQLVSDAPTLVSALPIPTECAELDGRAALEPPTPAQIDAVHQGRERLAKVRIQLAAVRLESTDAELRALTQLARDTGYEPFLAEVDTQRAIFAKLGGDDELTRELLLHVHERGLALGYDRLALEAALELIRVDSFGPAAQARELSRRWFAIASGLERRLGSEPKDEIMRRYAYGRTLSRQLSLDDAQSQLSRAVALARSTHGPQSLETAQVELALGVAYGNDGDWAPADELLASAIETYEARLSPTHPLLINPLLTRAAQRTSAGDPDGALVDAERAHAISAASYTHGHDPQAQEILNRLAIIHDLRGDYAKASAYFQALLEDMGETEGLQTSLAIKVANSLCFSRYKLGQLDAAEAQCKRCLDAAPTVIGEGHAITGVVLNNLGLIARARGDFRASLEHDRLALGYVEDQMGPDHLYVAYSLVGIGEGLLGLSRPAQAIAPLERAVEIRRQLPDPGELGEAECLLGQALYASGSKVQGVAKGREGYTKLQGAGQNWTAQATTCAAWLPEP